MTTATASVKPSTPIEPKMSVAALDTVVETQAAQLNLLLYQLYRPYFNGKTWRYMLYILTKNSGGNLDFSVSRSAYLISGEFAWYI